MGKEEVFNQTIDGMLEFDSGLDVNSALAGMPALETEKKVEKPEVEEQPLKNINKVLEKQVEKPEVKEQEEEEIKDNAPASANEIEESSEAPFTIIFAKDLAEQGLLSSFDEESFNKDAKEVGEAQALRNLIKSEIEANITAAKSDLDSGYQEYLNLVGKGIPPETAGSILELKDRFDKIKIDDLTNEDNVELRKQVMTDYFRLTSSMTDAKINKVVQSSIDLGDDVEDSKEYIATLKNLITEQIKYEEAQAVESKRLAEEETRRSIESLKEEINALSEIIPGVQINKQTKQQMYESLTKPIQTKTGGTTNALWAKRAENPILFDQKLAYLLVTGFFEKDKPWTKASQAKVTKEISTLEKTIQKNTGSRTGAPVLKAPAEEKKIRDNINALRGILE
jgi:hypothetical protein